MPFPLWCLNVSAFKFHLKTVEPCPTMAEIRYVPITRTCFPPSVWKPIGMEDEKYPA